MSAVKDEKPELSLADDAGASETDLPHWLRKWGLLVLGGFCLILLPWTVYLVYSLPSRHLTPHWSLAWAGFDVAMAGMALWTVVSILRRSRYLAIPASVTGTFLICDAWFDLVTSRAGAELAESSLLAVVGEVPLAVLCFWIAFDAERVCQRTAAYWERRQSERLRAAA